MDDARRVLVRLRKGGVILNRGRVEHHQIRHRAVPDDPAVAQAQPGVTPPYATYGTPQPPLQLQLTADEMDTATVRM